jgi:hypothetical protein
MPPLAAFAFSPAVQRHCETAAALTGDGKQFAFLLTMGAALAGPVF